MDDAVKILSISKDFTCTLTTKPINRNVLYYVLLDRTLVENNWLKKHHMPLKRQIRRKRNE